MENRDLVERAISLLDKMEKAKAPAAMMANIENGVLEQIRPNLSNVISLRSVLSVAASLTLLILLNYYAVSFSSVSYTQKANLSQSPSYDLLAIQTLYDE